MVIFIFFKVSLVREIELLEERWVFRKVFGVDFKCFLKVDRILGAWEFVSVGSFCWLIELLMRKSL